jgi:Domain of unknown function (DUF4160)
MPTIAYIGSIGIRIYYDDHGVPHFHAIAPEFDVKVAISDSSIISGAGRLRGRDLAAIRASGQRYRDVLYLNWRSARDGMPLPTNED